MPSDAANAAIVRGLMGVPPISKESSSMPQVNLRILPESFAAGIFFMNRHNMVNVSRETFD